MAKRLPLGEKLGYGVADVGASLTFVAVNTWLLYFLINIAKLEPLLAGVVFVAGRTLDAVLDPVMGVWSDRLKGRFKRKCLIAWGALPLGLSFALLWLVPDVSQPLRFVFALVAFMLFSTLFTVVQVPYLALTPEIAPDYDERTRITSFRMAFGTLASMLAFAVVPLVVLAFSRSRDLAQSAPLGWLATGALFGGIATAAYLTMAASVREPAPKPQRGERQDSFWSEARAAFAIYGFREIFALFMVVTVGIMILNSVLPFYLESSLQLPAEAQPLVLGTLFGVAIIAFPFWNLMAARRGKRNALVLGLLLLSVSTVSLVAFSPPGRVSVYLLALSASAGVGFSAVMLFPWAMLPDVIEFGELANGRRREGLVYALFTFGQKLAGSVGVFSNALVASLFGYQQGVAAQTPATARALQLMAGPVAAAAFLVAIVFVLRFPITKVRHDEAVRKLRKQ